MAGRRTHTALDASRVEIVDNTEALYELRAEWELLGQLFKTPLMQFDWYYACARTLCAEGRLRVLVCRDGPEISAVAPLMLVEGAKGEWLELLGSSLLHEPGGVLYRNRKSLKGLMKETVRMGMPVRLARLHADSPIWAELQSVCHGEALTLRRRTAGSCFIPIDGEWEGFWAAIGKKWQAGFRMKRRRAERAGPVSVDIFCPRPAELASYFDEAVDIEAASWKGERGTALRKKPALRNFFWEYTKRACESGILRLAFLRIADQPRAMHIGVEYAGKLWFLKTGYDARWAKLSPGMQLRMETIRHAFSAGLRGCEFLGSEEPWQHAWPVQVHRYCTVVAYPYSWRGVKALMETGAVYLSHRLGRLRRGAGK